MGENTSNANAGSKKDLSKYTEAKTKNVSSDKMNKLLDEKGYDSFDINCISISWSDNVKTIGGDEITESTSFATLLWDVKELGDNVFQVSVRDVKPENAKQIANRREKEKAKREKNREEREAREAEEREALETAKKDDPNDR